jgi:inosine-uridine preferring nucleoside hydrolase
LAEETSQFTLALRNHFVEKLFMLHQFTVGKHYLITVWSNANIDLFCLVGESGLDGTKVLPEAVSKPSGRGGEAIGAMYSALSSYPGKAWLVSTGTLTNIALLYAVYPHLVDQIAGLSIMGGSVGGFFTHAPLGRLSTRLKLRKNLHRDFPEGLPDDSDLTIPEVAKHFKELGILEGAENIADEQIHLFLEQARLSFGNSSPFSEFNVR